MKRVVAGSVVAAAAACAGTPAPQPGMLLPDWRGPAVHCRHLGDGGLEVELVAPTAGQRFELLRVQPGDGCVEVVLRHEPAAADRLVAQVVTPLRVTVAPAQLGDAHVVAIRIAPPAADSAARLAIVTARP